MYFSYVQEDGDEDRDGLNRLTARRELIPSAFFFLAGAIVASSRFYGILKSGIRLLRSGDVVVGRISCVESSR